MVSKLTNNVKPLDEVDKINEIIDELDNIDPLPSQTGQSGKYLTTNGTVPSWAEVQSLPSQTGKAGKFLQTDGTDASWEGVPGRNIGEIVASTIPLTDAGLHLLDGSLISGSGIYSAFVDYIADLYTSDPIASYFAQDKWSQWTQPVLTSSTSYGSVTTDYYYSDNENAWKVFDGIKGTSNKYYSSSSSAGNIIWHLPEQIKISSCKIYTTNESSYLGRFPQSITIYGSNDGSDWTQLGSLSGYSTPLSGSYVAVECSGNQTYSYIKWEFGAVFSGASGNVAVSEIEITAYTFASAEQWWQDQITQYGVCGKFVYDSTNNTVRLPKVTGIIEGTTDVSVLGDLVEAGLPNINGWFSEGVGTGLTQVDGKLFKREGNIGAATTNSLDYDGERIRFNAQSYNSVYGNSTTVQPQTIKAFYYIVIATSTKTDIQVDIDEIATDLNGKADVDLTNCTKPHIVETYVNGSSWYRVYSDGWCEQGGTQINITSSYSSVSLLKAYANTNYNLIAMLDSDVSGNQYSTTTITSTSTFKTKYTGTSTGKVQWQACGYIN